MTIVGKILAIVNIVAAAAFGYLVFLDYNARQKWSHGAYEQEVAREGLPEQAQYNDPALPRTRYLALEPPEDQADWLKKAFQSAGAGQPIATQKKLVTQLKDRKNSASFFGAVHAAADEFVAGSKDRQEANLRGLMRQLAVTGDQVKRHNDLIEAAKKLAAAKKNDRLNELLGEAARRVMLRQALLPLEEVRPDGHREQLAEKLGDLAGAFDDRFEQLLEARFDEVLRPQIPYTDLSANAQDPLQGAMVFPLAAGTVTQYRIAYKRSAKDQKVTVWIQDARTGQPANASPTPVTLKLSNVAGQPQIELTRSGASFTGKDPALGTDQVLAGAVTLTVSDKSVTFEFIERDRLEQRQAIAYLLFTLSQVNKPREPLADAALQLIPRIFWWQERPAGLGIPLGVPSEGRVELVVGRQQFNNAMVMQTISLEGIAQRRLGQARADFETFAEQYRILVKKRLPYLKLTVERHKNMRDDWQKQLDQHNDLYKDRQKFFETIQKQLQDERRKATAALRNLEEWQERLFQAQLQSAGVGQKNQELERKIRQLEKGR